MKNSVQIVIFGRGSIGRALKDRFDTDGLNIIMIGTTDLFESDDFALKIKERIADLAPENRYLLVYAGGIARNRFATFSHANYIKANVEIPLAIAEACSEKLPNRCKFCYLSSELVYLRKMSTCLDEGAELVPNTRATSYIASKIMAERSFAAVADVETLILRLPYFLAGKPRGVFRFSRMFLKIVSCGKLFETKVSSKKRSVVDAVKLTDVLTHFAYGSVFDSKLLNIKSADLTLLETCMYYSDDYVECDKGSSRGFDWWKILIYSVVVKIFWCRPMLSDNNLRELIESSQSRIGS